MKANRLSLIMLLLLLVYCLPLQATVDLQATPNYQILAWSPDESAVLAVVGQPLPEQLIKYQLARIELPSFKHTILAEAQPNESLQNLPTAFAEQTNSLLKSGYRSGRILVSPTTIPRQKFDRTLPQPLLVAPGQTLSLQKTAPAQYQLVLKETSPGIEPVALSLTDLTPRLQRDCAAIFDPKIKVDNLVLYINRLYVSPTLQTAIIPLEVDFGISGVYRHYTLLETIPLARESARLYNTCGYRLYQAKKYPLAEEQFILAYYSDSGYAQPLYNLACVCALTNRSGDALDYLRRAVELNPKLAKQAQTDPDLQELRREYKFLFKNAIGPTE